MAQTAQFVTAGNAKIGIIALSLALSPEMAKVGSYALVPDNLHEPLVQGFVVTKRAEGNPAAARFAKFVASERAVAVLAKYGVVLPR